MYRIKIEGRTPTQYRWYNDPRLAHIVAHTIIKNKDADCVTVENLKEKKIEKIYKRAWQTSPDVIQYNQKEGRKTQTNRKGREKWNLTTNWMSCTSNPWSWWKRENGTKSTPFPKRLRKSRQRSRKDLCKKVFSFFYKKLDKSLKLWYNTITGGGTPHPGSGGERVPRR